MPQSSIVREAVADKNSQGLVVDISADYSNEGDTVPYIKNGSPLFAANLLAHFPTVFLLGNLALFQLAV